MGLAKLTAGAVKSAITEFDELGQEAFLAKHGFKEAKRYWVSYGGKLYPSKAIAGVAHGYIDGQSQLLSSPSFTGGEGSVVRRLRQLGFEIQTPGRNPAWNRDELILALNLYFTNPGKGSAAVVALSDLLNKLSRLTNVSGTATFRNADGVYLKLMNLRSLDPAYTAQGKVGMKAGGALEKVLWADYEGRRQELAADAAKITAVVDVANEAQVAQLPAVEPYEGEEGGVIIRLHKRYERDPRLVRERKKAALSAGNLKCEVCGFDFEAQYGALGAEFIEVHHTLPVHKMKPGGTTKLTDLALLCSNCHRMSHRRREPLSLAEIKAALVNAG